VASSLKSFPMQPCTHPSRTGCPETSVTNYQFTLRNIPEQRRSQLHCDERLKPFHYSMFHSLLLDTQLQSITMELEREIIKPIAYWRGSGNVDWQRAGRSGDRIPVGARFSAPAQTGPGAHPAYCTMGTGSFPGVEAVGRGTDPPPPHLVPRP